MADMETESLGPRISELTTNIDALSSALQPWLSKPLADTATTLPLLEKAKLYTVSCYAIESLLFSALRLSGVDAKSHPVFAELARVKQYFEKIKTSEDAGVKRGLQLDKDAAGRFIQAALAGNDRYDAQRAQREEHSRARADQLLKELETQTERIIDEKDANWARRPIKTVFNDDGTTSAANGKGPLRQYTLASSSSAGEPEATVAEEDDAIIITTTIPKDTRTKGVKRKSTHDLDDITETANLDSSILESNDKNEVEEPKKKKSKKNKKQNESSSSPVEAVDKAGNEPKVKKHTKNKSTDPPTDRDEAKSPKKEKKKDKKKRKSGVVATPPSSADMDIDETTLIDQPDVEMDQDEIKFDDTSVNGFASKKDKKRKSKDKTKSPSKEKDKKKDKTKDKGNDLLETTKATKPQKKLSKSEMDAAVATLQAAVAADEGAPRKLKKKSKKNKK